MEKAAFNLGIRTVVLIIFAAVFLSLAVLWISGIFSRLFVF